MLAILALTVVPAFAAGLIPADHGTGSGICTGDKTGIATRNRASLSNAKQSGFGIRKPSARSGTITRINSEAGSVTITVSCGNHLVNTYLGIDVTCRPHKLHASCSKMLAVVSPISFTALAVGQNVSSSVTLINGVFTANRITSVAQLLCISN